MSENVTPAQIEAIMRNVVAEETSDFILNNRLIHAHRDEEFSSIE